MLFPAIAGCWLASLAHADTIYRVLRVSGSQAPGLPAGVLFDHLGAPRANADGSILFWAHLSGPGVTTANDASLWVDRGLGLTLLAREGDAAPEMPGFTLGSLEYAALNEDSSFALTAEFHHPTSPLTTRLMLLHEVGGTLIPVAIETTPIVGFPETHPLDSLPIARPGPDGMARFAGHVHESTNVLRSGLWVGEPGGLSLFAKQGDLLPGMPADHSLVAFEQPVSNAAGDFLFRASMNAPQAPITPRHGIFIQRTIGGPVLVALTDLVPPVSGASFAEVSPAPALFDDDAFVFWARLHGPEITPESDAGLFHAVPGGAFYLVVPLLMEGEAAPGIDGVVIRRLAAELTHTTGGAFAFAASLVGPGVTHENNTVLYRAAAPGEPFEPVVREGDELPGLPGVEAAVFNAPILGPGGRLAFFAQLRGVAVTSADNEALLAVDPEGTLRVIARKGDELEIAGTPRQIRRIVADAEATGLGHGMFKASGSIVFKLEFTDKSHAIVAASVGPCRADCEADGDLDLFDYLCFLDRFANGDLYADFEGDGDLDLFDFLAFQQAFTTECP